MFKKKNCNTNIMIYYPNKGKENLRDKELKKGDLVLLLSNGVRYAEISVFDKMHPNDLRYFIASETYILDCVLRQCGELKMPSVEKKERCPERNCNADNIYIGKKNIIKALALHPDFALYAYFFDPELAAKK